MNREEHKLANLGKLTQTNSTGISKVKEVQGSFCKYPCA